MFVTGPNVVKTVTHEEIDFEGLGGARIHNETSGVAHFLSPGEPQALELARTLIGYLPPNNVDLAAAPRRMVGPPASTGRRSMRSFRILRSSPTTCTRSSAASWTTTRSPRSMRDSRETSSAASGAVEGRTVGIVAQQPEVLAGVLDIDASDKAARFVRTCDCFNIPIITLVDVPGFLPGVEQEHRGIIRHGAKLLYAYCEATVPKVTVITRKAYGGAYDVMSSKHVRGDMNYAWPTAEIAVMGVEGAVNIIFRDEISAADDPAAERARLVAEYEDRFANPYVAAARGYVDEVILPSETRTRIAGALAMLEHKRQAVPAKKHGNIPLCSGRRLCARTDRCLPSTGS